MLPITIVVFFATTVPWKIGGTCFSIVCSVLECGTIYKFHENLGTLLSLCCVQIKFQRTLFCGGSNSGMLKHLETERNDWTLKLIRPTFRGWKDGFFHDITMLKHTVKSSVADNLASWLASLP
jgi:hypothetical protein